MIAYSINMFLLYSLWSLSGFAIHILADLKAAKSSKLDFSIKVFFNRNVYKLLLSLGLILIGCALFATSPSQIKEMPAIEIMGIEIGYQFILVSLGYNGGAGLQKLLKKKEK